MRNALYRSLRLLSFRRKVWANVVISTIIAMSFSSSLFLLELLFGTMNLTCIVYSMK
ncbi:hypothetical protein PUN28_000551 [Cardiocondyla obscurior]|uniref:Uncharacterized protein n=1 Tax=Cardiocondyla obscurior TaxID=286306 RepID=A0AAW2H063_9HYME